MRRIAVKRYSEAFKQQVVREYEGGRSMKELSAKYGIGGGSTISAWVTKYGRAGLRQQLQVVQSPSEQESFQALQERNERLEKVVAQLLLDKVMLESALQVAEAQLGETIKKSIGVRS
jgi:transposase-like protein